MNVGKSYRLSEFLVWTRREVYLLAAQLMANQGLAIKGLFQTGAIVINFFIEMQKQIMELLDQQGRSERTWSRKR